MQLVLDQWENVALHPGVGGTLQVIERTELIAYEFYWNDQEGVSHLIGILPERRKKPERITKESIMNWGKKLLGDSTEVKDIYFIEVSV